MDDIAVDLDEDFHCQCLGPAMRNIETGQTPEAGRTDALSSSESPDGRRRLSIARSSIDRESEPLVLSGTNTPAVLIAAWAMLIALLTKAETVQFDISLESCKSQSCNQKRFPFRTKPTQISLDWSASIENYLLTIKDLSTSSLVSDDDHQKNIESRTPISRTSTGIQTLLVSRPLDSSTFAACEDRLYQHELIIVPQKPSKDGHCAFTALFDEEQLSGERVVQLLRQYEQLVRNFVRRPSTERLNRLDLLCPADRRQLLKWNGTYPRRIIDCVHRLVEKRSQLQPSAPAVCGWDADFTYSSLCGLSDKLAMHLMLLGVRAESAVLICFDKSAWAAVAMLSILKAGGAIVALDPNDSRERAKTIISAADIRVCLMGSARSGMMEGLLDNIITVDSEALHHLPDPREPVAAEVNPENTAWIM